MVQDAPDPKHAGAPDASGVAAPDPAPAVSAGEGAPEASAIAAAGARARQAGGSVFGAALKRSLGAGSRYLGQTMRLMVGMPDYDRYVAHVQRVHPGQAPMSYEEFFRNRQDARYGGRGRMGCC